MAVLTADLAQEAQTLRREWEPRNRAVINERPFGGHHSGFALSSLLRSTGNYTLLHSLVLKSYGFPFQQVEMYDVTLANLTLTQK